MKLLKAIGALLLLGILLAGVPLALLTWGSPGALLQVDWGSALRRPDDGTIMLGLLSVAGWLAWLVLAATTVSELVATLSRGMVVPRLPGTGWLRPAVGALVAAALAPVLSAHLAASDAPHLGILDPVPAAAQQEAPPAAGSATGPRDEVADEARGPSYTVQRGDELWSLAERLLGSGERWRDIVAVNPGMTVDTALAAGTQIALPPDAITSEIAAPGVGADSHETTEVVVVQPGDTLWDLADEHLDDPNRWPELHEANRDLIKDPDLLHIGWELVIEGSGALHGQEPEAEPPAAESPQTPAAAADEPDVSTVDLEATPVGDVAEDPTAAESGSREEATAPAPTLPASPPAQVATPTTTATPGFTSPAATPSGIPAPGLGQDVAPSADDVSDLLGPVGAVLAAGIFAGVAAKRRTQLLQRAVGRRILPVSSRLQQFWSSLGRRAADGEPSGDLDPTTVVLGWHLGDETDLHHSLEAARATSIHAAPQDASAAVAAMVTGLLCAPWSTSVEIVVVGSDEDWATSTDDPRVRSTSTLAEALVDLKRTCAGRRIAMGSSNLDALRTDPDLAPAWVPVVFLFSSPLADAAVVQVQDSLALGNVGVSVVAAVEAPEAVPASWSRIELDSTEHAHLMPGGTQFVPQLLSTPARRAVVDLFAAATRTETEPARWWVEDPLPPNVKVLPGTALHSDKDSAMPARSAAPIHPTLLLLGTVELEGATGPRPHRSVAAALESCTWLLTNPGSTPTKMLRDLGIAETTRRSNLSRLRGWLGFDEDSEPYFPDAYNGLLELHPEVTSDWERFQMMLAGGVNNASRPVLGEALRLVRGEPLSGMSFQWPWADSLRTDMISMVTDAAAVLADQCIAAEDFAMAEWAIAQGRLALADDEHLAVREIHLYAAQGQRARMDQAIRALTRSARAAGRDLSAASVQRIQDCLNLAVTSARAN